MRRIFKPEDVRRDKRVVQIPDVEFEFTPIIPESESEEEIDEEAAAAAQALAEEEEKRIALETSLRAEIEAKVREELIGELGRKKITAQKQCDTIVRDAKIVDGYKYIEPSTLEEIKKLKNDNLKLPEVDKKILKDKIYGAWMGRICGCLLGKTILMESPVP